MKGRRLLTILAAGLLACTLVATGGLAQGPTPEKSPVSSPRRQGLKITLQGKVQNLKVMGGYYIRGTTEVFKIANQNPHVLEPLAKSGDTVTIEAFARGDLLTIDTLNGKKYEGKPPPVSK